MLSKNPIRIGDSRKSAKYLELGSGSGPMRLLTVVRVAACSQGARSVVWTLTRPSENWDLLNLAVRLMAHTSSTL